MTEYPKIRTLHVVHLQPPCLDRCVDFFAIGGGAIWSKSRHDSEGNGWRRSVNTVKVLQKQNVCQRPLDKTCYVHNSGRQAVVTRSNFTYSPLCYISRKTLKRFYWSVPKNKLTNVLTQTLLKTAFFWSTLLDSWHTFLLRLFHLTLYVVSHPFSLINFPY